jgi:phage terminase large subunit-like protein
VSGGAGNAAKRVANHSPGPWRSWRRMSRHGRAIKFIQLYCRPPKGEGHGKPMHLAGWQKSWLEEALATGIRSAVSPMPTANGKSTFGAAAATWATFDEDETGAPQVPILATTVNQAIKSVYGVAASMVRTEPELESRSIEYTGVATPKIFVPANEGTMFPISNDIDGIQGLDFSVAIVDELGFQDVEVWSSMLARGGKRSRSLVWGTGTPGLDRENALWAVRKMVLEGHRPPSMAWREYAADPGCDHRDRRQWRKANPALRAGYMSLDGLESALAMPEAHFRIFRLGQWVDGVDGWLGKDGRAVWDLGNDDYQMVDGAPTWVGLDVGLKRDSTALVWVQYRTDRPDTLHAEAKIWTPTPEVEVDVTDVMAYIRTLDKRYKLGAVSYDPRFFDVPAKMLHDEGIPLVEVPQSVQQMTGAIGTLYELLIHNRTTHSRDPLFAQQVLNAVPRMNAIGFTLEKGKSRGRIDSAIAYALAVDRAQHKPKPRAPLVILRV